MIYEDNLAVPKFECFEYAEKAKEICGSDPDH